jgi:hypothetical protein
MTSSSRELDAARELVRQVLARERTVDAEPHLLDDDLLAFAIAILSRSDPGWLLRRSIDAGLDYDARLTVISQLSGPPRDAALPFLRAEHPEHETWRFDPSSRSAREDRPRDAVDPRVAARLDRLEGSPAQRRDRAAEELRDLCVDAGLPLSSYRQAADALLRAALTEAEPATLESILNTLAEMANVPDQERVDAVDWSPLAARLEDLEQPDRLALAVAALGATGHPQHRVAISRLASHPSDRVREVVTEAIQHIDARSSGATG